MSASKRRCVQATPTVDPDAAEALAASCRKRVAPAEKFIDGTILESLADEHLHNFKKIAPHRAHAPRGCRTWGSMCSGSEGAHFVLDAFQKAVVKSGTPFSIKQRFSCEVNKAKQTWINNLVNKGNHPGDVCIFADAQDMRGSTAKCVAHNKECTVEPVDLLIVGTSCKDMSRASTQVKAMRGTPVLSKQHSLGGSASAFFCPKRCLR